MTAEATPGARSAVVARHDRSEMPVLAGASVALFLGGRLADAQTEQIEFEGERTQLAAELIGGLAAVAPEEGKRGIEEGERVAKFGYGHVEAGGAMPARTANPGETVERFRGRNSGPPRIAGWNCNG